MLFLLDPDDPDSPFPDVSLAETEPNGLLAVGGDLSVQRLYNAYRHGIFPWYNDGDPILWWSPDPRTLLYPDRIKINRSLRKTLRRRTLSATMDQAFDQVIDACSGPRRDDQGTWLLPEMLGAYKQLHRHGLAHSVEVWQDGALVGGLYGVAVGAAFFGESMFSRISEASKVALVHLCEQLLTWQFGLIDCQVLSDHLIRMGAEERPRAAFIGEIGYWCALPGRRGSWDDGETHYPGDRPQDWPHAVAAQT